MKKLALISTLLILLGLHHLHAQAKVNTSEICGTWELINYNYGGGDIVVNSGSMKRIKTITTDKFVWVHFKSSDQVPSASAGGSYIAKGNTYTESIDVGSSFMESFIGTQSVFTYHVDGNILTIKGDLGNGLNISEQWQKVNLPEGYQFLMNEHLQILENTHTQSSQSDNKVTFIPLKAIQSQTLNSKISTDSNINQGLILPEIIELVESENNLIPLEKKFSKEIQTVNVVGATNPTSNISNFKIFPNPTTQSTTLSFSLDESTTAKISLIDLKGQECYILENKTQFEAGNHQLNIDIHYIQSGIYILTLQSEGNIEAQRLIVQ